MARKFIERFKQGLRMLQTTDNSTEKWVVVGEIASTRAILPNNHRLKVVVRSWRRGWREGGE